MVPKSTKSRWRIYQKSIILVPRGDPGADSSQGAPKNIIATSNLSGIILAAVWVILAATLDPAHAKGIPKSSSLVPSRSKRGRDFALQDRNFEVLGCFCRGPLRNEILIGKKITENAPFGVRCPPEGPKAAAMHPGTGGISGGQIPEVRGSRGSLLEGTSQPDDHGGVGGWFHVGHVVDGIAPKSSTHR